MIALLLNSGRGTRMGDETREHPKCMVALPGGKTILSHQLEMIRQLGIYHAVITTGPHAKLLEQHARASAQGIETTFVPNPDFAKTNYIVSMFLAEPHLHDDVLLLHGDLVMGKELLQELCSSRNSAVIVDRSLSMPEKDFKAEMHQNRVLRIGVEFFSPAAVASQPAYFIQKEDMRLWMSSICAFVRRGEITCYAENALNPLLTNQIDLRTVDANGRLCNEIDNPDDWRAVSSRFETEVL